MLKRVTMLIAIATFTLTLNACGFFGDAIDEAIEELDYLDGSIESAPELPEEVNGVEVEWSSSDSFTLHPDGFFNPPAPGREAKLVELEATLDDGATTREETFEAEVRPRGETTLEEATTLPFENLANEFTPEDGDLDLYYPEDGGTPYVEAVETLELLEGAIRTESLEIDAEADTLNVVYEEEYDEDSPYEDVRFELTLDAADDTLSLNRFGFFGAIAEETETDFGEGLETIDYEEEREDGVEIDLGKYRLDMRSEEEGFLLPFNLANLLFSGGMYDLYYNGEAIYGIDTYQIMDDEGLAPLYDSPYDGEELPTEIRRDTVNHLALTFDHFYGLQEDLDIEAYTEYLVDFIPGLDGEAKTHYDTLHEYALSKDDPHTSFVMGGPYQSTYQPPELTLQDLGERTRAFNERLGGLQVHCMGMPDSETTENVGFLRFDGFDEDTPDLVEEYLDDFEDEGVDAVVLDLTCNTGGVMGAVYQILGFMTDEPIQSHSINRGDGAKTTTTYTSENEAYDFEWYIATSAGTYSAGNYLAANAQDANLATVIGEASQGGAASVTTNITPSGGVLVMSSDSLLADSNHNSLEIGIEPDISLPPAELDQTMPFVDAIAEDLE